MDTLEDFATKNPGLEPADTLRRYSQHTKLELLKSGEWDDQLVNDIDEELAGFGAENGLDPKAIFERPEEDDLRLTTQVMLDKDPAVADAARSYFVAQSDEARMKFSDPKLYDENLALHKKTYEDLITPEKRNLVKREAMRSGDLPFAMVDGALEFSPVMRDVVGNDEALAKLFEAHPNLDPSLLPAVKQQLTTAPGYAVPRFELNRQSDLFGTLQSVMGKDPDIAERVGNLVKSYERNADKGTVHQMLGGAKGVNSDPTLDTVAQLLENQGLGGDFSRDEIKQYVNDFALAAASPQLQEGDVDANVTKLSTGQAVLPMGVLLNKQLFDQTMKESKTIPAEQKDALMKSREARVSNYAPDAFKIIADNRPEFARFLTEKKEAGATNAAILDEWMSNPENHSSFRDYAGGLTESVAEGLGGLVLYPAALAGSESARDAVAWLQKSDSDRRAYARLFGKNLSAGYDLSRLIAPVAADIAVTIGTAGAAAPLIVGKTTAKTALKTMFRTALTAETKSALGSFAKAAAVRAGGKDIATMAVDDVLTLAGRDIAGKLTTGVNTASYLGTAFNRSAGSTYVQLHTQLSDQTNPDGSKKYSPEQVREIALNHGLIAGTITAAVTGGFSMLGKAGMEGIYNGITRKQLNGIYDRMNANWASLSPAVKAGISMESPEKMLESTMRKSLGTLWGRGVTGAVDEFQEEALDQALGYINQQIATGDKIDPIAMAKEAVYAGMLGGVMGGTVVGVNSMVRGSNVRPDQERMVLLDTAMKLDKAKSPQTAAVLRKFAQQLAVTDVDGAPVSTEAPPLPAPAGFTDEPSNTDVLTGRPITTSPGFTESDVARRLRTPADAEAVTPEAGRPVIAKPGFTESDTARRLRESRGEPAPAETPSVDAPAEAEAEVINETPTPQEDLPEGVPASGVQPTSGEPAVGGSEEIVVTDNPDGTFTIDGRTAKQTQIGGKTRWQVQTEENRQKAERGERQIGGDLLFDTREEATQETTAEVLRERANAESRAKAETEKSSADTKETERLKPLTDFSEGMTPMQRGKAEKVLRGTWFKRSASTGKEYKGEKFIVIRDMIADGYRPVQDGDDYRFEREDGAGYTVNKTEFTYAQWAVENQPTEALQPAPTEATADSNGDVGPELPFPNADGETETLTLAPRDLAAERRKDLADAVAAMEAEPVAPSDPTPGLTFKEITSQKLPVFETRAKGKVANLKSLGYTKQGAFYVHPESPEPAGTPEAPPAPLTERANETPVSVRRVKFTTAVPGAPSEGTVESVNEKTGKALIVGDDGKRYPNSTITGEVTTDEIDTDDIFNGPAPFGGVKNASEHAKNIGRSVWDNLEGMRGYVKDLKHDLALDPSDTEMVEMFAEAEARLSELRNPAPAPQDTLTARGIITEGLHPQLAAMLSQTAPGGDGQHRKALASHDTSSPATLLASLAKSGPDKFKPLARLLQQFDWSGVTLTLVDDNIPIPSDNAAANVGGNIGGVWIPETRQILLMPDSANVGTIETALHEMVHAATEQSLKNPNSEQAKVVKRIEGYIKNIKKTHAAEVKKQTAILEKLKSGQTNARGSTLAEYEDMESSALQLVKDTVNGGVLRGAKLDDGKGGYLLVTKPSPGDADTTLFRVTQFDEQDRPSGHVEVSEDDWSKFKKNPDHLRMSELGNLMNAARLTTRADIFQSADLGLGGKNIEFSYKLRNRAATKGAYPEKGFLRKDGDNVIYSSALNRKQLDSYEMVPVGAKQPDEKTVVPSEVEEFWKAVETLNSKQGKLKPQHNAVDIGVALDKHFPGDWGGISLTYVKSKPDILFGGGFELNTAYVSVEQAVEIVGKLRKGLAADQGPRKLATNDTAAKIAAAEAALERLNVVGYGVSDNYEFLAHMLTSEQFRTSLEMLPKGDGKSFVQLLFDAIADLLLGKKKIPGVNGDIIADLVTFVKAGDPVLGVVQSKDARFMPASEIEVKAYRYVNRDGVGMLNSDAYNIDKLNDDDASELEEWLNYGLQQPRDVANDQVFLFTEEGDEQHAEGLRLLKKAARRGFMKQTLYVSGEPSWESGDGQIAVSASQVKTEPSGTARFMPASPEFAKSIAPAGTDLSNLDFDQIAEELEDVRPLVAEDIMHALVNREIAHAAGMKAVGGDAEYLAAVEAGDMETAQRMVDEAAKAAGYKVKAYHATMGDFDSFTYGGNDQEVTEWESKGAKRTLIGASGKGFFFSVDPNRLPAAHNVGGMGNPKAKVLNVFLKIKNPLIVDSDTKEWAKEVFAEGYSEFPHQITNQTFDNLTQEGYDSVEFYYKGDSSQGDPNEVVVLSPDQIKSADPVTRDSEGNVIPLSQRFNTTSPDIRFMPAMPARLRSVLDNTTTGNPSNADRAHFIVNPEQRPALVSYLKGAANAIWDRLKERFDTRSAVYVDRLVAEVARAESGYRVTDGVARFMPAMPSRGDTPRFNELTAGVTPENVETWKQRNPEKHAELKAMREKVLKEQGFTRKMFHGTRSKWTKWDSDTAGGLINLVADQYKAGHYAHGGGGGRGSITYKNSYFETEDSGRHVYEERTDGVKGYRSLENPEEFLTINEVETEIKYGSGDLIPKDSRVLDLLLKSNNPLDLTTSEGEEELRGAMKDVDVSKLTHMMVSSYRMIKSELSQERSIWVEKEKAVGRYWSATKHEHMTKFFRDHLIPILKKRGYDAIEMVDDAHLTTAVFDSSQIKSTEPLSFDDKGNLITPDQWGDTASPDIRFMPAMPPTDVDGNLTFKHTNFVFANDGNKLYTATDEDINEKPGWLTRMFARGDDMRKSLSAIKKGHTFRMNTMETKYDRLNRDYAQALKKEGTEEVMTKVREAGGDNRPMLTPEAEERVNVNLMSRLEAGDDANEAHELAYHEAKVEMAKEADLRRERSSNAMEWLEGNAPLLHKWAKEMRDTTDEFQTQLHQILINDRPEAAWIVDNSYGVYITRTWRIHQDPAYAEMVLHDPKMADKRDALIEVFTKDLVETEIKKLAKDPQFANVNEADLEVIARKSQELQEKAKARFQDLVMGHEYDDSSLPSTGLKTEYQRLLRKKNLDDAIEDILGRIDDPQFNANRTMQAVSGLIFNQKLLTAIKTEGLESGTIVDAKEFASDPMKYKGWKPLVSANVHSSSYAPLAGYYAPEADVVALNAAFGFERNNVTDTGKRAMATAEKAILAASNWSLMTMTLGSVGYFVRGMSSAPFFMGAQGVLPGKNYLKSFQASYGAAFATDGGGSKNPILKWLSSGEVTIEFREKMVALGILKDGVHIGFLRDLKEHYAKDPLGVPDWIIEKGMTLDPRIIANLKKGGELASKALNQLERLADFTENTANVAIFLNELDVLVRAKAYDTIEECEQEAARRTKAVTPSKSERPQALKEFQKQSWSALIAPFAGFRADMLRITANTYREGWKDARSTNPVIRRHGIVRLASAATMHAGITMTIPLLLQSILGFDDEEDKALRAGMPAYSRGSQFWMWSDGKGGLTMLDLTYTNPWSFVFDVGPQLWRSRNNLIDTPEIIAKYVGGEMIGENIVAGSLLDVARNHDEQRGGSIWFETDDFSTKVTKAMKHVGYSSYTPQLFKKVEQIVRATSRPDKADEDFFYTPFGIAAGMAMPTKPYSRKVEDTAFRAFRELGRANRELSYITGELTSKAGLGEGKAAELYNERMRATVKVAKKAHELAKAYQSMGLTRQQVMKAMTDPKGGGFSKERAPLYIKGFAEKYVLPVDKLREIQKIDPRRYAEVVAAMRKHGRYIDVR